MNKHLIAYKSNLNVTYSCRYHVVWCPKYRRPVLEKEIADDLKDIAREVCIECKADLFEIEVMPDHVHLLIGIDPQFGVHRLVKAVKGRTSRLLRRKFRSLRSRLPTLWTNSYFVSSVGGAPLELVKQYIENQKGF